MKTFINFKFVCALFTFAYSQINIQAINKPQLGLALAFNSAHAQMSNDVINSWGYAYGNYGNFGKKIDASYSWSVLGYALIEPGVYFRMELGFTQFHFKSSFNSNPHPSSGPVSQVNQITQDIKQRIFKLNPGIQWTIFKNKTFEFYTGAQLNGSNYFDMHYNFSLRNYNPNTEETHWTSKEREVAKGGYALGAGVFGGVKLLMGKHLRLGAESSFSLMYTKIGGLLTVQHEGWSKQSNETISTDYYYDNPSSRSFDFTRLIPSFNLAYMF